jgi:hypothetical protein
VQTPSKLTRTTAEPEGSASLIPTTPAAGHDPEPGLSTCHLYLHEEIFLGRKTFNFKTVEEFGEEQNCHWNIGR